MLTTFPVHRAQPALRRRFKHRIQKSPERAASILATLRWDATGEVSRLCLDRVFRVEMSSFTVDRRAAALPLPPSFRSRNYRRAGAGDSLAEAWIRRTAAAVSSKAKSRACSERRDSPPALAVVVGHRNASGVVLSTACQRALTARASRQFSPTQLPRPTGGRLPSSRYRMIAVIRARLADAMAKTVHSAGCRGGVGIRSFSIAVFSSAIPTSILVRNSVSRFWPLLGDVVSAVAGDSLGAPTAV